MTLQVSSVLPVEATHNKEERTALGISTASAIHRCELVPADLQMDWWRQDRERKWRHHHASREQNRSGGEAVSMCQRRTHGLVFVTRPFCYPSTDMFWHEWFSEWCWNLAWFFFSFLQTNHDWGRRAESQRAERHVYWDQCQDRLQCQTGDPCSFPIFHNILGVTSLSFFAFLMSLQGDWVTDVDSENFSVGSSVHVKPSGPTEPLEIIYFYLTSVFSPVGLSVLH